MAGIVLRLLYYHLHNLTSAAEQTATPSGHLLPSFKSTCYNLRSHGHGLSVSLVKSELHKKTFIDRVLFSECY